MSHFLYCTLFLLHLSKHVLEKNKVFCPKKNIFFPFKNKETN